MTIHLHHVLMLRTWEPYLHSPYLSLVYRLSTRPRLLVQCCIMLCRSIDMQEFFKHRTYIFFPVSESRRHISAYICHHQALNYLNTCISVTLNIMGDVQITEEQLLANKCCQNMSPHWGTKDTLRNGKTYTHFYLVFLLT